LPRSRRRDDRVIPIAGAGVRGAMRRRRAVRVGVLVGIAGLAGCDGDDMGMAESADELPEARDCTTETRADDYAVGLAKTGAAYTVTFVDAMPAPPTRGDNTWRVRVADAGGAAMSEMIMDAAPFMPDHMHGTSIVAHVSPGETAGEYVIAPVSLFMPGLWEVTLELVAPDGTQDEVVFGFCVDP